MRTSRFRYDLSRVQPTFRSGSPKAIRCTSDFTNSELPKLDDTPIPERTEKIQHGIFKSFVPPLALYALLGLIMHSQKKKPEDAGEAGHDAA